MQHLNCKKKYSLPLYHVSMATSD